MGTGSDAVIETDVITKRFGSVCAVDQLSLSVAAGEVVGFLGPNGAGKSTTMRLLLGFLVPTSGTARVVGADLSRDPAARRRVGYLPGDFRIDPAMTGEQLFRWYGRLRGVHDAARVHELAERLDLDVHRPFRELSKGTRQKVGIVQAFQHDPDVLILDEPTSGLDPLVQREFQKLVQEASARGAGVLLSSHVLSEVEHIASRMVIIRRGALVLATTMRELSAHARHRLQLHYSEAPPADLFHDVPGVVDVHQDGELVTIAVDGSMDPAMRAALTGPELVRVGGVGDDLEDLFASLYEKDASDSDAEAPS